jgi:hypothetical protein
MRNLIPAEEASGLLEGKEELMIDMLGFHRSLGCQIGGIALRLR